MTDPSNLNEVHGKLLDRLGRVRSRSVRARLQYRLACLELWRELLATKQAALEELEKRG